MFIEIVIENVASSFTTNMYSEQISLDLTVKTCFLQCITEHMVNSWDIYRVEMKLLTYRQISVFNIKVIINMVEDEKNFRIFVYNAGRECNME